MTTIVYWAYLFLVLGATSIPMCLALLVANLVLCPVGKKVSLTPGGTKV